MPHPKTYELLIQWLGDPRFDLAPRANAASYGTNHYDKPSYWVVRTLIRMNDGTTASLQYSNGHYSRGSDQIPQSFEIWHCPHDDVLDADRDSECTDPYAFVATQQIIAYLDLHGGIMDLKVQLAMNAIEHSK